MKRFSCFNIIFLLVALSVAGSSTAQNNCPDNIDFEAGSFNNWTCLTGFATTVNGKNVINLNPSGGPIGNRHTMLATAAGGTDLYGNFPINCPNGSGHSIKIGNDQVDSEAEAVSYVFTIPANANFYSLVYQYALVLEDTRNTHPTEARPRMETKVINLTDNQEVISCSSLTFIGDSSILGFYPSDVREGIVCKDWSAITINLNGYAGKTIELKFTSADCTYGAHFGYAYIDVNIGCGNPVYGTTHCANVDTLYLKAPVGFADYTWYNSNFTQVLGFGDFLSLTPVPADGTGINVVVVPFNGYGCPDTLFNKILTDTAGVTAYGGPDKVSCNQQPVPLGAPPEPGYRYAWLPSAGLTNTGIANPIASPATTTTYILTAFKDGAGCVDKDTVVVQGSVINADFSMQNSCINTAVPIINNSTAAGNTAVDYLWDFGNGQFSSEKMPVVKYQQPGTYPVKLRLTTPLCIGSPVIKDASVVIDKPRPATTYPLVRTPINFSIPLQAKLPGVSFVWKPSIYLSNVTAEKPFFKGLADQVYTIEVTSASGCKTVDTQQVKLYKKIEVYVPTAFTPDKNGLNDLLQPVLLGIKQLKFFRVYNRWGQLVFDTNTEGRGWDGLYNGKLQPMQAYIWIIEAVDIDGVAVSRKGSVLLMR
jgi:gliding motility-associated-like protein